MSEHATPRVNSAILNNYIGRSVRLTCKTLRVNPDVALVEASDGGQITVRMLPDAVMPSQFVEIICQVQDPSTVKMQACINLGDKLDMKLVNDVVELSHDSRFTNMFNY
ncbi:replication factor A protein 3 [Obba rivulosa]|uniref:Replication factor A protein 3 n=1 Tax=Obba rivulosa TaxID=1052685 RepID=A0A8E2AJP1_9APHY|nr:replication factor A protein 3 [Obba rivulosa]